MPCIFLGQLFKYTIKLAKSRNELLEKNWGIKKENYYTTQDASSAIASTIEDQMDILSTSANRLYCSANE